MASSHDIVLDPCAATLIRVKSRQLCRRTGFSRTDCEDLEQELSLHLIRRAHHFDPARGATSTFAARAVNSGLVTLLRERARQKRSAGCIARSLEEVVGSTEGADVLLCELLSTSDQHRRLGTVPQDPIEQRELADALARVTATLPPELRELCKHLTETTPTEAARELKLPRSRVRKAIEQIRRRFEDAGIEDS